MKLIVTLDDNNGMMFNHRRQSRDKAVGKDILDLTKASRLFVLPYTVRLFQDFQGAQVVTSKNPFGEVGDDDYCFIEGEVSAKSFDEIIIYRWNRKYPGDVFFDIDLNNYNLISSKDFAGNSHEKITREIYRWCK